MTSVLARFFKWYSAAFAVTEVVAACGHRQTSHLRALLSIIVHKFMLFVKGKSEPAGEYSYRGDAETRRKCRGEGVGLALNDAANARRFLLISWPPDRSSATRQITPYQAVQFLGSTSALTKEGR